jgi:tetratricopeptide (TPR) repeat protein
MKQNLYVVYLIIIFFLSGCARPKKNKVTALVQQASVEAASENFQRALELTTAACELDPEVRYQAMRGTLLYQVGRYQEAVDLLESLLKNISLKKSMRADIMNNLASGYSRLGQQEKALELWQELTSNSAYITPEVAWCNIGLVNLDRAQRALYDKDAYRQALVAFKKALSVSHEYIDALYYAGYTAYAMHDYQQSIIFLEQLIRLAPEHGVAQQLLQLTRDAAVRHTV